MRDDRYARCVAVSRPALLFSSRTTFLCDRIASRHHSFDGSSIFDSLWRISQCDWRRERRRHKHAAHSRSPMRLRCFSPSVLSVFCLFTTTCLFFSVFASAGWFGQIFFEIYIAAFRFLTLLLGRVRRAATARSVAAAATALLPTAAEQQRARAIGPISQQPTRFRSFVRHLRSLIRSTFVE